MRGAKKHIWYTVWLSASDELLAFGFDTDCARTMNKTPNNFKCLVNQTKYGKTRKFVVLVEDLATGEWHLYGESRPNAEHIEWDAAWRLYEDGWWDVEIARRTGLKAKEIYNWRRKNNLPRNSKGFKRSEVAV